MGALARLKDAWAALAQRQAPAWAHPYILAQMGWTNAVDPALGIPLTPQAAQRLPTVYSCLAVISGALAAPPWQVIRHEGGGMIVEDSLGVARALDSLDFVARESVTWDTFATGNGFIRVYRAQTGGVGELERLVASAMTIKADSNAVIGYAYMDPYAGRQVELTPADIVHVRCRTLAAWPIVGVPPLLTGRTASDIAGMLEAYKAHALANGCQLRGYLQTDSKLDRQRANEIGQVWRQNYSAPVNAARTPVLEQGLKFVELNPQNFEAMQLREASRIAATEICKLFNIPPSAVGEIEHANRSTAQTELDLLYRLALAPAAERVADQVGRQLLTPVQWAGGYSVRIDLESWVRGSGPNLADLVNKLTLGGVITPDEARGFLNMPAAAGGDGARLLRPVNMGLASDPSPIQPVPGEAPAPPPAAEPVPPQGAQRAALVALPEVPETALARAHWRAELSADVLGMLSAELLPVREQMQADRVEGKLAVDGLLAEVNRARHAEKRARAQTRDELRAALSRQMAADGEAWLAEFEALVEAGGDDRL
jgi:HK97 family phage portal protein